MTLSEDFLTFLDIMVRAAGIASNLLLYVLAYKGWRMWLSTRNPILARNTPTGKYMLRRMFCHHNKGYTKVRDAYGRNYTACTYCGADVNAGKSFEERV